MHSCIKFGYFWSFFLKSIPFAPRSLRARCHPGGAWLGLCCHLLCSWSIRRGIAPPPAADPKWGFTQMPSLCCQKSLAALPASSPGWWAPCSLEGSHAVYTSSPLGCPCCFYVCVSVCLCVSTVSASLRLCISHLCVFASPCLCLWRVLMLGSRSAPGYVLLLWVWSSVSVGGLAYGCSDVGVSLKALLCSALCAHGRVFAQRPRRLGAVAGAASAPGHRLRGWSCREEAAGCLEAVLRAAALH